MFDFLFDTDFLPMSESQVDDIDNDDVMTEEEDAMMEAYESIGRRPQRSNVTNHDGDGRELSYHHRDCYDGRLQ